MCVCVLIPICDLVLKLIQYPKYYFCPYNYNGDLNIFQMVVTFFTPVLNNLIVPYINLNEHPALNAIYFC